MRRKSMGGTRIVLGSVAVAAVMATAGSAFAGGFALREQSAEFQGMSFAGSGAGSGLSSMFWNSAAAAAKTGPGLFMESHYALLFPEAEITVTSIGGAPVNSGSGDIGGAMALVGASYASYQLSENLFLGMAFNSPFGLTTKPDNNNYLGAVLGRTSKLLTLNANPTLAYVVTPGVTIGVGAQIQWGDGKFRFASTFPPGAASTAFEGDGWAFGATAGIMLQPSEGTSIGLGWRSQLTQELKGDFTPPGFSFSGKADIELPDVVTLSFRHAIADNMRLLGTVEWTNWSRFKELRVEGMVIPDVVIPANWSDSWFFALGGEYDYSDSIVLRAGAAYEISPVDAPEKRLTGIPDSNRIWLSMGATYKMSESTSLDFAYTHIFLEDAQFARTPVGAPLLFTGELEAKTDIFSASMKTKW